MMVANYPWQDREAHTGKVTKRYRNNTEKDMHTPVAQLTRCRLQIVHVQLGLIANACGELHRMAFVPYICARRR
jgi:hypothetical protein